MNTSTGWIKLYRGLSAWEWWDDPVMVKAFIAILFLCSSDQTSWHGVPLRAGEFVTSIGHLAQYLNVSFKQTRTILQRLQMTGEISIRTTNRCSIIYVVNWNLYQDQIQNDANEQEKSTEKGNPQVAEDKQETLDLFDDKANKGQTEEVAETTKKTSVFPFETFWEMYGKKRDRKKSEVAYARITEKERAKIKEHLPRYVESTPDVMYRKNPLTYIHGACWNDEIATKQSNTQDRNGVIHGYQFSDNESGTGTPDWMKTK